MPRLVSCLILQRFLPSLCPLCGFSLAPQRHLSKCLHPLPRKHATGAGWRLVDGCAWEPENRARNVQRCAPAEVNHTQVTKVGWHANEDITWFLFFFKDGCSYGNPIYRVHTQGLQARKQPPKSPKKQKQISKHKKQEQKYYQQYLCLEEFKTLATKQRF